MDCHKVHCHIPLALSVSSAWYTSHLVSIAGCGTPLALISIIICGMLLVLPLPSDTVGLWFTFTSSILVLFQPRLCCQPAVPLPPLLYRPPRYTSGLTSIISRFLCSSLVNQPCQQRFTLALSAMVRPLVWPGQRQSALNSLCHCRW